MEDVAFGLSHYQLIALILSNVFPIDICISIVGCLKLSEFELSRKEYLVDRRSYKKELVRYVEKKGFKAYVDISFVNGHLSSNSRSLYWLYIYRKEEKIKYVKFN